jgi:alpha-galactosidase
LNKWSPEDFANAKRLVAAYHAVQRTIAQGDLYRLISPRDDSKFSATETVSANKNQAVVFAFADATTEGRGFPLLELQGLDPAAEYKLAWIEGEALPGTPQLASGDWWMHHGVQLDLRGDYQAAAFQLDRQR